MSDVETLRRVPLLKELSEAQLKALLSVVRLKRVPQGTLILREGEPGDSLFILTRGSVEISKRLGLVVSLPAGSPKEKVLVRLEAPQLLGEMGLLGNAERSATAIACTDCDLLEIAREDFQRLAEADFALGYLVLRNIAAVLAFRLQRADRDIVKLTIALSLALGNR